jgi:hypothetical protein
MRACGTNRLQNARGIITGLCFLTEGVGRGSWPPGSGGMHIQANYTSSTHLDLDTHTFLARRLPMLCTTALSTLSAALTALYSHP